MQAHYIGRSLTDDTEGWRVIDTTSMRSTQYSDPRILQLYQHNLDGNLSVIWYLKHNIPLVLLEYYSINCWWK